MTVPFGCWRLENVFYKAVNSLAYIIYIVNSVLILNYEHLKNHTETMISLWHKKILQIESLFIKLYIF